MKIKILSCVIPAALFFLFACNTSPSEPSNPLFQGTGLITVYSPTNKEQVSANYPDFTWKSSGFSYEVAAVFNGPIQVSGRQIQNTNACIAMWTTGMTGIDGNVNYSLFMAVSGGVLTASHAAALTTGTYYWAVWAYDSGLDLTNSSPMITFSY